MTGEVTSCPLMCSLVTHFSLKSIFKRYYPEKIINEINYNQRFINQQRWIYQDHKIEPIHPVSCLDVDHWEDFRNISFTPKDCIHLYQKLEDIFEDIEEDDDRKI